MKKGKGNKQDQEKGTLEAVKMKKKRNQIERKRLNRNEFIKKSSRIVEENKKRILERQKEEGVT